MCVCVFVCAVRYETLLLQNEWKQHSLVIDGHQWQTILECINGRGGKINSWAFWDNSEVYIGSI